MRHPRNLAGAILLLGTGLIGSMAPAASAAWAGRADDVVISSLDIDWNLTMDERGLTGLRTVERLNATFGYEGEDRRIERSIPLTVDGVAVQPVVDSVADGLGEEVPFTTRASRDRLTLSFDVDASVRGPRSYVVTYSQYNVASADADPARDAFSWDADVEGWGRSIPAVTASIVMVSPLAEAFGSNTASCQRGFTAVACHISATPERDFVSASFPSQGRTAGGPLYLNVKFPDGTFVAPVPIGDRLQLSERTSPSWTSTPPTPSSSTAPPTPSTSPPSTATSPERLVPEVPEILRTVLAVVALLVLVVAVVVFVVWATRWRDLRG